VGTLYVASAPHCLSLYTVLSKRCYLDCTRHNYSHCRWRDKLIVHVAYSQLYAAVAYLPLRKMATVINVYVRELGEVGGGGGKGKVCVLS